MTKKHVTAIGLTLLWLFLLKVFVPVTSAQDEPAPVNTNFVQGCYVALDFETLQMHFYVMADGNDVYTVEQVNIPEGQPVLQTNIPATINTHAGYYDLGWVKMKSENSPYTFTLRFTQVSTGLYGELPWNTWSTTDCSDPDYQQPGDVITGETPQLEITPEPDGTECKATAIDGATGLPYCYDTAGLTQNLSGYVVPIPPATR